MVADTMDMLGRDEAQPDSVHPIELAAEIAANGEAIVTLEDGRVVELHGDDTYFYTNESGFDPGIIFTETETPGGDEAETWIVADSIVSIQRH